MTKSEVREKVFLLLFRAEFHDEEEYKEQLKLFVEEEVEEAPAFLSKEEYITSKFKDICAHLPEIDALIDEKSDGWKTSRMSKMDLTIIRLDDYEMKYEEDIPSKVSINEAVELAKKYGTDDSPAFVNGILAKLYE